MPFGRSGIRFSILPSPTGDLDFPRGRFIATLCQADLIGVYAFRMRKMRSRGCLLYAEIFGVLEPDPTTSSDRVQSHSSSSQPAHFDDLFSFDASTKIHFRSPVRPSPDPALPPGSSIYPRTSPTASFGSLPILCTRRMATGSAIFSIDRVSGVPYHFALSTSYTPQCAHSLGRDLSTMLAKSLRSQRDLDSRGNLSYHVPTVTTGSSGKGA